MCFQRVNDQEAHMEISMLEEFVQLVESGSFQETAARMNISPSALTKHIHKLEEELDVTLFDRSQRSIQVNSYSRCFYPHARQVIQAYREGVASLNALSQQESGRFTVAYDPVVAQYGLVDLIADFARRHPEHNMSTLESRNSMKLLEERRCDFAFVREGEAIGESAAWNKLIFRRDRLAIVVPQTHPLAEQDCVTFDQIRDEQFILHGGNEGIVHDETRKFLELCAQHGVTPNVVGESQFTTNVLRYVLSGRGIAVLNRMRIPQDRDIDRVRVVDLSPTIPSYVYLLYPRRLSSPCAQDFLHFIIDQCGC